MVPALSCTIRCSNLADAFGVVAGGLSNEGVMPSPVSKDWLFVGGLLVVVVAFCAVACDLV